MSYLVTTAALQVDGSTIKPQGSIDMQIGGGSISMGSGTGIGFSSSGGFITFNGSDDQIILGSGASRSDLKFGATSNNPLVLDGSSNEILQFTYVASAVNYLQINNSATGVDLGIVAAGDDTDVDIDIIAKGSGAIRFNDGLSNGGGGITLAAGTNGLSSLGLKAAAGSSTDDSLTFPSGFDSGVSAGDVLEVASISGNDVTLQFATPSGGGLTYNTDTASNYSGTTLSAGNIYAITSLSSSITVNLPSGSAGNEIVIIDSGYGCTASATITVSAANLQYVGGSSDSSFVLDSAGQAIRLIYNATGSVWNII